LQPAKAHAHSARDFNLIVITTLKIGEKIMSLIKKTMQIGFSKRQKCPGFLTNLFRKEQLDGIKVEIQKEIIDNQYAVDVQLGTGGRRVDFNSFDVEEYTVPEYNNYGTITEEDMFKVQFGETEYEAKAAKISNLINKHQTIISGWQRYSEEKQAADGLFNGQIVLANGKKITFNKKASHSITPDYAWNNGSGNPVDDLADACQLAFDDGKIGVSTFNLILENQGLAALLGNAKFQANSNKEQGISRTDIQMPVEKTPGAMFHGQFSVGSYKVNVWSYNAKYKIPTGYGFDGEGTEVGFIKTGTGLLVPENPNFVRYYGAVNDANAPSELGGSKLNLQKVEQLPYAYDKLNGGSAVTIAGVKSRPMLVPVDIDCFISFGGLVSA